MKTAPNQPLTKPTLALVPFLLLIPFGVSVSSQIREARCKIWDKTALVCRSAWAEARVPSFSIGIEPSAEKQADPAQAYWGSCSTSQEQRNDCASAGGFTLTSASDNLSACACDQCDALFSSVRNGRKHSASLSPFAEVAASLLTVSRLQKNTLSFAQPSPASRFRSVWACSCEKQSKQSCKCGQWERNIKHGPCVAWKSLLFLNNPVPFSQNYQEEQNGEI